MSSTINKPNSYVLLRHDVCDFFERQTVRCCGTPEVGGILIGSYRGPHMEVIRWTEPGPTDVSSFTSFTKHDRHHQAAASAAWRKSSGTETYIGEWHTHPFGDVIPSRLDHQTWKKITRQNGMCCSFVLVSPAGWGVFLVPSSVRSELLPLSKLENGETGIVFG